MDYQQSLDFSIKQHNVKNIGRAKYLFNKMHIKKRFRVQHTCMMLPYIILFKFKQINQIKYVETTFVFFCVTKEARQIPKNKTITEFQTKVF